MLLALLLALYAVLAAGPVMASVPSTMSYQGVLTDGSGNLVADGPYNLTFNLYTVASGGSSIWTETDTAVPVTKGGFSVVLGNVTPLSSLAFDAQYYLGITVGGGPELAPRVVLTASPYGLSLRLPFSGDAAGSGSVLSIRNTSGSTAITADPTLDVGSTSSNGSVNVFRSGSTNAVLSARVGSAYGDGGQLDLMEENGAVEASLFPYNTDGYWLYIGGDNFGYNGIAAIGNSDGSSDPELFMLGNASSITFNMGTTGDNSALLPANAIDSGEILDEPGIGSNHNLVIQPITSTSAAALTNLQSVTITTPTAGYIVVDANAEIGTSAGSQFTYQISEVSGGPTQSGYYHFYGSSASTFLQWSSLFNQRVYVKPAGTYTFYFQAYITAGPASNSVCYWPTVTATFYPTNYGTVTAVVSSAEAASFQHATPVPAAAVEGRSVAEPGYQVDLSELVAKETAQREALVETQRQIARVRMTAAVKAAHPTRGRKP
jgi:hypothetical protein